ncbi:helix-turn-helix domain-containing protein [Streptomyces sp. NPDC052095]|uniref:helix-turn-helix domain-containing protein n=1 Tax=unclassified Streptomyces TaxID=2593676 RepID=UPI00344FD909
MGTQQASAPARPVSAVRGVEHVNTPHTSRFTVIGNHLAQHRELSLLAIGLATHIQSLPNGARVTIKHLTERFPEGEIRIAKALRELEAHGYLSRDTEHLANGRIVTRTRFYNQPRATASRTKEAETGRRRPDPRPVRHQPAPAPVPVPVPMSAPVPSPAPVPMPVSAAKAAPVATLPHPREPHAREPHPKYTHAATALLSDLHRHAPQITLTGNDVALLAPLAATWFERDTTPSALRHALTNDLPHPLKHPAKLLRHRLTAYLPSPPRAVTLTDPLQNCDTCDRAYRAPAPGRCPACDGLG